MNDPKDNGIENEEYFECSSCHISCGEDDLDRHGLCDTCRELAEAEGWFDDD